MQKEQMRQLLGNLSSITASMQDNVHSLKRLSRVIRFISECGENDKIRISQFAKYMDLSPENATPILDSLVDINILKKTERVYRCPKCGLLLGVLTIWDEGDDITCYHCDTTHPNANVCDTETIYSKVVQPELKLFTVTWDSKYEKSKVDGFPLTKTINVIAYTQADAESMIHEFYHYVPNSIKVSEGVSLENKMFIDKQ